MYGQTQMNHSQSKFGQRRGSAKSTCHAFVKRAEQARSKRCLKRPAASAQNVASVASFSLRAFAARARNFHSEQEPLDNVLPAGVVTQRPSILRSCDMPRDIATVKLKILQLGEPASILG